MEDKYMYLYGNVLFVNYFINLFKYALFRHILFEIKKKKNWLKTKNEKKKKKKKKVKNQKNKIV